VGIAKYARALQAGGLDESTSSQRPNMYSSPTTTCTPLGLYKDSKICIFIFVSGFVILHDP